MAKNDTYVYNEREYFYKLNPYFALQFAEVYGGKVYIVTSFNHLERKREFVNAFVGFVPGVFIDAKGVFYNVLGRSEDFQYRDADVIKCNSIEEAKSLLKSLKVSYTNAVDKKNVREFFRNNMPTFEVIYANAYYYVGIMRAYSEDDLDRNLRGQVLCVSYHENIQSFSSYVQKFPFSSFNTPLSTGMPKFLGFKENKNWYYTYK